VAKEPFLTTTGDEPGAGPDVPGVTSDDGRSTLARLLGERRLPSLPAVPRPSLPAIALPSVSRSGLSLPGRRRRRDAGVPPDAVAGGEGEGTDVVDPRPDTVSGDALEDALEDVLVEAFTDDGAEPEDAAGGSFDEMAAWVRRAIAAYPRPSFPLEREWDVSVQGIVRLVPYVPRFATAPLGLLDRFGAVTVGPGRVGLDGKDVEWDRVVEVRTAPAWTCLSAEALEVNLAQYVVALPPLPGRAWVLRKVSELLLSLYLAVLPPDTGGDDAVTHAAALLGADGEAADAEGEDAGGRTDPMFDRVVTQVVYRRRFGSGEAQASATSVLLQLALPGTTGAIVRTAAERGVAVVHVRAEETSVGSVVARAATWRRTALDLRERVDRRVGR
jgi:hypothetical protein